jgi:hypothetical protein
MPSSNYTPALFFAVSVDGFPGSVSSVHEVPGGYLTVIDHGAYARYIRAGHSGFNVQNKQPAKYFKDTGLEEHSSFRNLSFQELFETSHAGQVCMAKDAAAMLSHKYPAGIPHRIMMDLKERVMDDAKHAVAQAEVATTQYREQSEENVVAAMLALLLRTRRIDSIIDAAGEPVHG